jgi:tetratricopeptide (TPR) repeat protein
LASAIADFEKAVQLQADHVWAHYSLALCYLKTGRPKLAVPELTACLAERPDFPWFHLLRGSAWGELGRFDEADRDFDRAARLALDESARYGLLINRGVLRIRQGRQDEAEADLQSAVTLRPQLYQGHVNLAQAYLRLQRLDEALRQLDEAVRLEPDLAALYRLRARARQQRPDLPAALADLDLALAKSAAAPPAERADLQVERAQLLLQLKRLPEAAAACDAALRDSPKLTPAHRLRAEVFLEMNRYDDALRALDLCLKHGAATADVYRARADVLARLGRYPAALADYSRVLELKPDAATLSARGWTYVVMDAPKLALADFQEALRRDLGYGEGYLGRGHARLLLGEVTEGLADVEEGLRRGPPSARLLYNAARAYAQGARAVKRPGRLPSPLQLQYQQRAVELLADALELVPAAQRAAFWNNYVQPDPALAPLRQEPGYLELAARYGAAAR